MPLILSLEDADWCLWPAIVPGTLSTRLLISAFVGNLALSSLARPSPLMLSVVNSSPAGGFASHERKSSTSECRSRRFTSKARAFTKTSFPAYDGALLGLSQLQLWCRVYIDNSDALPCEAERCSDDTPSAPRSFDTSCYSIAIHIDDPMGSVRPACNV